MSPDFFFFFFLHLFLKYNVQEFKLMHVVIDLFGWVWTESVNTDMKVGQPWISGCQQLQTFSCPHQTCLLFDCFFSLIKCQAGRLREHCAWQPADFWSSPNWPHNKKSSSSSSSMMVKYLNWKLTREAESFQTAAAACGRSSRSRGKHWLTETRSHRRVHDRARNVCSMFSLRSCTCFKLLREESQAGVEGLSRWSLEHAHLFSVRSFFCGWNVGRTCCLTRLTLAVGAELMSKMHKYTNRKNSTCSTSVVKLIQSKRANGNWKPTKSSVWPSFLLFSSVRWLCLLPPSFSLIFLLYPQTPSSVFSLHRWAIPHQNNGLLCFIELPMSLSHFLSSFPSSIWHGLFSLLLALLLFIVFPLLGGLVAEMEKKNGGKRQQRKGDEWRMQGFVWNREGEKEKKLTNSQK